MVTQSCGTCRWYAASHCVAARERARLVIPETVVIRDVLPTRARYGRNCPAWERRTRRLIKISACNGVAVLVRGGYAKA